MNRVVTWVNVNDLHHCQALKCGQRILSDMRAGVVGSEDPQPGGEHVAVFLLRLLVLADLLPATKYLKGDATVDAVEINEQLTLDFGDFDRGFDDSRADGCRDMLTWLLLFHVDYEGLRTASSRTVSAAGWSRPRPTASCYCWSRPATRTPLRPRSGLPGMTGAGSSPPMTAGRRVAEDGDTPSVLHVLSPHLR